MVRCTHTLSDTLALRRTYRHLSERTTCKSHVRIIIIQLIYCHCQGTFRHSFEQRLQFNRYRVTVRGFCVYNTHRHCLSLTERVIWTGFESSTMCCRRRRRRCRWLTVAAYREMFAENVGCTTCNAGRPALHRTHFDFERWWANPNEILSKMTIGPTSTVSISRWLVELENFIVDRKLLRRQYTLIQPGAWCAPTPSNRQRVQFVISRKQKTKKNESKFNRMEFCRRLFFSMLISSCMGPGSPPSAVRSSCGCCFSFTREEIYIYGNERICSNIYATVMAAAVRHGTLSVTKIYMEMKRLTWYTGSGWGMGTARAWDVGINWQNTKCTNTKSLHPRTELAGRLAGSPRWTPAAAFWCRCGHCCLEINSYVYKRIANHFAATPKTHILIWNNSEIRDTHTKYDSNGPHDAERGQLTESRAISLGHSKWYTHINFDFQFILIAPHTTWMHDAQAQAVCGRRIPKPRARMHLELSKIQLIRMHKFCLFSNFLFLHFSETQMNASAWHRMVQLLEWLNAMPLCLVR